MAATPKSVTITATQERVTKGAVRYQEDKEHATDPEFIGQIYIKKGTFAALGVAAKTDADFPTSISVTVAIG
jgi:hypothetical protein